MKTYLKIKIKSLAAEAKIIRAEERKWPGQSDVRHGLHAHRVCDVRSEARVALLAYGFLRGRTYAALEFNPESQPNWTRVLTLASKYGGRMFTREEIAAWAEVGKEAAKAA